MNANENIKVKQQVMWDFWTDSWIFNHELPQNDFTMKQPSTDAKHIIIITMELRSFMIDWCID